MGGSPKPQPVDTSIQEKQLADQEAQQAQVQRQNDARRRAIRGRSGGYRSLLFGTEAGVTSSPAGQTLGAN